MTTLTTEYKAPVAALENGHVGRNVESIAELEMRDRIQMGPADHLADRITTFAGSMVFVGLHVVWFTAWLTLNSPISPWRIDPFPFGLLTLVVSLEAIFLTSFVMISQNRQALQADKRAKIDLQVNMIAEQEVTKLMSLVADIHEKLGLGDESDGELDEMRKPTYVGDVADAVDAAQQKTDANAAGPSSAADTEA